MLRHRIGLTYDALADEVSPDADAAEAAAAAGVPVTTIAYGTDEGVVRVEDEEVAVPVDREALAAVAEATGGRAFEAATAAELASVYDDIGREVAYEVRQQEVTAWFAGLALACALAVAAGAPVWTSRLP